MFRKKKRSGKVKANLEVVLLRYIKPKVANIYFIRKTDA